MSRLILLPEHRLTHSSWNSMMERCSPDAIATQRKNYFDRGVRVCDRWHNFHDFFADVGPRPSLKHSIDRIDTNGNYEPGNCRWATFLEQQRNRTNNRFVEFNGATVTFSTVASLAQPPLSYMTVFGRLRRGWPAQRALSAPLIFNSRR